jgi:hypothetical protein
MRKFSRLSDKIDKKGYSFDPNKKVFRPRKDDKNKTCYNYGEKGYISPNCSKPVKRRSSFKNKKVQKSSDEEEDKHKGKNKSFERKKSYNKKSKHFVKKKSNTKRSFVVGTQEWVTDVSSSEDEDIIGVTITNHEISLPPPPMCLMAKGNSKVNHKAGGKHWVLDSGYSQYMISNDSMFTSLGHSRDHDHVTYGDNTRGRVAGLVKIAITKDFFISNVLYVESLSFNLLSVAQLYDFGLMCTFDKYDVIVFHEKDKSLVFKGFRYGHIYLVDFSEKEASSMTCLFSKTSLRWL